MTTLLTAAQKRTCQSHEHNPAPNGPRAKALLALDSGKTQQQAAAESGLSIGQVRYCLRRFRAVSLAIFDSSKPASTVVPSKAKDTSSSGKEKKKPSKKTKKLKPIKTKKENSDKNGKGKKSDKKSKNKTSEKKGSGKKNSKNGKKKKKK